MLKTEANRRAVAALLGIGRAYVQRHLIAPRDARALCARLEPVLAGAQTGVVVVALVILLLRSLGVGDPFDESRLTS